MAKIDEDEDLLEKDDDNDSSEDKDDDADEKDSGKEETVEVTIEDDDKDEKIAVKKNKEYSQESIEEKRERRREEKKKKKHQDFLARQDARKFREENAVLRKEMDELKALVPQFKQRVDSQDEAQLDTAINSQANVYRQAEAQLEKAITEGNGALAKEAQRVMFDANNKYNQLTALKQSHKAEVFKDNTPAKEAAKPQVGEAHKLYAQRWAVKNDWFDPRGDDEDSETARDIDKLLMAEGYDPNKREFWDEFNLRLREELPHVFDDKPARKSANPRPKQVNGSIGADSTSSGAKTIKIPERVVQMAKDAGYWDDPKMKKVFINNWQKQQNVKAN